MEGRVSWTGDIDKVAAEIAAWKAAGATHLSINTMDAGLATVDDHLAVLERVARRREVTSVQLPAEPRLVFGLRLFA